MNYYTSTPCNPIQCIVPPHMVDAIKLRGSEAQKEMARAIEEGANAFRVARQDAEPPNSYLAAPTMAAKDAKGADIQVFDANQTFVLPGTAIAGTPKSGDRQADEAHLGAQETYDLFLYEFQRDSLDGQGMALKSSVHVGRSFNNAFWDGQQMAYGDGDGIIFEALSGDVAVIGHELSHGVVQFSGGLIYQNQSGALNEHIADVFGSLTKQRKADELAADADWAVGAGLIAGSPNEALRSLRAPGTAYQSHPVLGSDPQPYHMDDYVFTFSDNGGVHINSGIPNHAFYLLSMMLGGKAADEAGRIWYAALQSINSPHARFKDWADETVMQARAIFGVGSMQAKLTRRAWKLVGIDV